MEGLGKDTGKEKGKERKTKEKTEEFPLYSTKREESGTQRGQNSVDLPGHSNKI